MTNAPLVDLFNNGVPGHVTGRVVFVPALFPRYDYSTTLTFFFLIKYNVTTIGKGIIEVTRITDD